MNAGIRSQFRMKGEGGLVFVSHGDDASFYFRKDIDRWVGRGDVGGTDEIHAEGTDSPDFCPGDEASQLPSVGVSFHGHRKGPEAGVFIIGKFPGEKDHAGAGGQCGQAFFDLLFQGIIEVFFFEKFPHGGAFSSRKDEAVKGGKVVPVSYFHHFCPQGTEHGFMLQKGALEGKNADDGLFRFFHITCPALP